MRSIPARRVLYTLVIAAAIPVIAVVVRARQDRRKAELHVAKLEQARDEVIKMIEQKRADGGNPIRPSATGDYDTPWSLRNGDKPPPHSN